MNNKEDDLVIILASKALRIKVTYQGLDFILQASPKVICYTIYYKEIRELSDSTLKFIMKNLVEKGK